MTEYRHSPKIICITGPRAAGKTTVAKRLAEKFGYLHVWLDGINSQVCEQLGIELGQVNLPTQENFKAYADIFRDLLKGNRYQNIVFEGERIRFPYILTAFLNNVMNYYGEYAIIQGFSLVPDLEKHLKQFELREILRIKQYIKKNAHRPPEEHEGDSEIRDFDLNTMPDPEGFEVVDDPEAIMQWARDNAETRHPALPEEYADIIKTVADSETYTPFYQTVEVDGNVLIRGMTRSDKSWKNVELLGVDFKGKHVVDLGAMHGYFTFRAEQKGAKSIHGLELNPSSVEVARAIARARKSKATFGVCNVDTDPLPKCDVMLAMNMLHWVKDQEAFVRSMAEVADEIVMEIGEVQIKKIMKSLREVGFASKNAVVSHRPDKFIGQRYLFHLARKQEASSPARQPAQTAMA